MHLMTERSTPGIGGVAYAACVICGDLFVLRKQGQECCSAKCRRRKSRQLHRSEIERLAAETRAALERLVLVAVKPG